MSKRIHDADLCDRIRALEQEVERLKASQCHHYHWYPRWSWNTQPHLYYGTNTSNSTILGLTGE